MGPEPLHRCVVRGCPAPIAPGDLVYCGHHRGLVERGVHVTRFPYDLPPPDPDPEGETDARA